MTELPGVLEVIARFDNAPPTAVAGDFARAVIPDAIDA
jgi:hypothetical protein